MISISQYYNRIAGVYILWNMGIIQDNHRIWKKFNIRSYSNTFRGTGDLNDEVNVLVLSGG